MHIAANERVLLVGKTGSGKTFLARQLLSNQPRVLILDGKGLLDTQAWKASRVDFAGMKEALQSDSFRVVITPSIEELYAIPFLLLTSGSCVIYIDEAYSVFQSRAGKSFNELWTRGREHGIGVWASTQRPTWISLFVLSESEHYFVFRLTWSEDRERMRMLLEMNTFPTLRKHSFIYAHPESNDYTLFSRVSPKLTVQRISV